MEFPLEYYIMMNEVNNGLDYHDCKYLLTKLKSYKDKELENSSNIVLTNTL